MISAMTESPSPADFETLLNREIPPSPCPAPEPNPPTPRGMPSLPDSDPAEARKTAPPAPLSPEVGELFSGFADSLISALPPAGGASPACRIGTSSLLAFRRVSIDGVSSFGLGFSSLASFWIRSTFSGIGSSIFFSSSAGAALRVTPTSLFLPEFSKGFWLDFLSSPSFLPSGFPSILSINETSTTLLGRRRLASGFSHEKRRSRTTRWNSTDIRKKRFILNTVTRHWVRGKVETSFLSCPDLFPRAP